MYSKFCRNIVEAAVLYSGYIDTVSEIYEESHLIKSILSFVMFYILINVNYILINSV